MAVLYLALVGVPLLALLGVLRTGAALEAPASLGGEWSLEATEARECIGAPSDRSIATLTIQQSGTFARLDAVHAAGDGRVDGDRVRAVVVPALGPCAGRDVELRGTVRGDELHLRVSAPACASCTGGELLGRRSGT